MINFRLKKFDKIVPVGKEPNLYLSWFYLTDGDLWLRFSDQTIYEYSKEAVQHFGDKLGIYNSYYIVRFLEDFTELFEKINVSIPDNFYKLTENIGQFRNDAKKWIDLNVNDDEIINDNDIYFYAYNKLISWINERNLYSSHLIGGPQMLFFRHKDRIRIVWDTEQTLENGISLWTAKNGNFEMNYSDFIHEVKSFGQNFFEAMDKQIELTVGKEWRNINVDKERLVEEHKERKLKFNKNLFFLEQTTIDETDWTEIEKIYELLSM